MTTNDFDPTTNRVPYGLLTPDEQEVLKAWPHGWEYYLFDGWCPLQNPEWVSDTVYRGKPAPVTVSYWEAIYPTGPTGFWRDAIYRFKGAYSGDVIGLVQLDITDGVPSVRIVEVPR
jgi:hypothetical protein